MALVAVDVRIKRYNPDTDAKPHWQTFTVKAEPTDRVLDVLHTVKWEQDGTVALSYKSVVAGAYLPMERKY